MAVQIFIKRFKIWFNTKYLKKKGTPKININLYINCIKNIWHIHDEQRKYLTICIRTLHSNKSLFNFTFYNFSPTEWCTHPQHSNSHLKMVTLARMFGGLAVTACPQIINITTVNALFSNQKKSMFDWHFNKSYQIKFVMKNSAYKSQFWCSISIFKFLNILEYTLKTMVLTCKCCHDLCKIFFF